MDHHRWWLQVYSLDKTMWGVDIHETGMRALEQFGCYDGLDLPNSAGLEVILRQCQLAEYVYVQESGFNDQGKGKRGKGGGSKARAGLLDEASVFTGTHRDSGETMICPELLDYVAKEVERDASVMKAVRKAREERRAGGGAASRAADGKE